MSTQHQQDATEPLRDKAVAAFLLENPDFFIRNQKLVRDMRVPHNVDGSVSLIEHQVRVLRDENRQLRRRLDELLIVARDNDRLADRLHRLTLDLMSCADLDTVIHCLKDSLRNEFKADAVALRLFHTEGDAYTMDFITRNDDRLLPFVHFLREKRPVCGPPKPEQTEMLFGDTARHIGSVALIPVLEGQTYGFLAIASFQPERFHPGQGTVFLRQLGTAVARAVRPYLAD